MRQVLVGLCLWGAIGGAGAQTVIPHRDVIPGEFYLIIQKPVQTSSPSAKSPEFALASAPALRPAMAAFDALAKRLEGCKNFTANLVLDGSASRILAYHGESGSRVSEVVECVKQHRLAGDPQVTVEQAPVIRAATFVPGVARRIGVCPSAQREQPGSVTTGSDVAVVYVFDTGIDPGSVGEDLVAPGIDVVPGKRNHKREPSGHGTTVAQVIAGVTRQLKLVPVRMLDENGEGSPAWLHDALEEVAKLEAGQERPFVCNMSFSAEYSPTISEFLREFISQTHATVVTSAGNTCGADACLRSPGNVETVINVGSSGSLVSATGACVDVVVPGEATSTAAALFSGEVAKVLTAKRRAIWNGDLELCLHPESPAAPVDVCPVQKSVAQEKPQPRVVPVAPADAPVPRTWWLSAAVPLTSHTAEGDDVPFGPADLVTVRHPFLALDTTRKVFGDQWRFSGTAKVMSLDNWFTSAYALAAASVVRESPDLQFGAELSQSWFRRADHSALSDTTLSLGVAKYPGDGRCCVQPFVGATVRASRIVDHESNGIPALDRGGYTFGAEVRFAIEDFRKQDVHVLGPLFFAPPPPHGWYADLQLGYDWAPAVGEAWRGTGPYARTTISVPLPWQLHLEPSGFIAHHDYDRMYTPAELEAGGPDFGSDVALRPVTEWAGAAALRWTSDRFKLWIDVTLSYAYEDFGASTASAHATWQLVLTLRQRTAGQVLRGQTGTGSTVTTIGSGSTSRPRPTPILK